MKWLMAFFFGCNHSRLTFPRTRRERDGTKFTYRACLHCGAEVPYDREWVRAA